MAKTPDYPVPALEKGLDILEALAAAAIPQSLADLAIHLKRSRNELFRMLNCLERRGYVTRDPVSSKYSLSLKLYTLAHGHEIAHKLVEASRIPMQVLTEHFRVSCHLSIMDRGRLLVIAQQESPERVRLSIEVGAVFDAARTASGRLLLAFLDANAQSEALSAAELPPGALAKALESIRRSGTSIAESETIEGVRDVAVLVGSPKSGLIAALAVTRLLRRGERPQDTALLEGMRSAARDITRSLGLL